MTKSHAIPRAIDKFTKHDRGAGSRSRLRGAIVEYFRYQGCNRVTANAWATEVERRVLKRWVREEVKKGYNDAEMVVIDCLVNTPGGRANVCDRELDVDAVHSLANRGIIILIGEDEERDAALAVAPYAD